MPCNLAALRRVTVALDAKDLINPHSAEVLQKAFANMGRNYLVSYQERFPRLAVSTPFGVIYLYENEIESTRQDNDVVDLIRSMLPRWKGRLIQEKLAETFKQKARSEEWLPDGRLKITV